MITILDCPSPNFDERKLPVSMIVVHYTETKTCEQALRILCDPNAAKRVSSHWVIDRKRDPGPLFPWARLLGTKSA